MLRSKYLLVSLRNNEKGVYLVLIAFFSVVLVGLCALALGLGMVATNKARMTSVSNLAAMAALEEFSRADLYTDQTLTYNDKADKALERANTIIQLNQLPGTSLNLMAIAHPDGDTTGGSLTIGNWYPELPQDNSNPCSDSYPCFIQNSDPYSDDLTGSEAVNAIKLTLKNSASNPLLAPFTKVFGKNFWILETNAISTVVQRCTAYLIDLSTSSATESHLKGETAEAVVCGTPPCSPLVEYTNPANASLFAYRDSAITGHDDSDQESYTQPGGKDLLYWVSMDAARGNNPIDPQTHYQDDYKTVYSFYFDQNFRMDYFREGAYEGPQPLTRTMQAFNAGLREVASLSSSADLATLIGFTNDIRSSFPVQSSPDPLTRDIGMLIQLTNLDNLGTKSSTNGSLSLEIHPNFVDFGWFPVLPPISGGTTNIVKALDTAITMLGQECPANSRKMIVLATDGISNSVYDPDQAGSEPYNDDGISTADYYTTYVAAKTKLLGTLKDELLNNQIALTVIVDSPNVRPNIKNVAGVEDLGSCVDNNPNCYLSYEQAKATNINPSAFFDSSSPNIPSGNEGDCPDPNTAGGWKTCDSAEEYFFTYNTSTSGEHFGDPIGVLGELAMDSGGYFCPILSLDSTTSNYVVPSDEEYEDCENIPAGASPCILKNSLRTEGATQTVATRYLTKSEQGVECVVNSVGENPFILVTED